MNPGLVVKLRPTGPWRIGPDSGARNRVDAAYHSDSLYAAVCSAMARMGLLEEWLDATARHAEPAVAFSSCFPFLDDIRFVVPPRSLWPPTAPALLSARVRWKAARFVPLAVVEALLAGRGPDENQWAVDGPSECLLPASAQGGPFRTALRWNAAVDRLSGASDRHSTACTEFRPGAGLWTIAAFSGEAARERWADPVKAAFRWLADAGFGGERSRGWGRSEAPEFQEGELLDLILPSAGSAPGSPGLQPAMPGATPAPAESASEQSSRDSATLADARGSDPSLDPSREGEGAEEVEPETSVESAPPVEAEAPPEPEPAPAPAPPIQRANGLRSHWLLSLFTPAAADAVDWSRGSYTLLSRAGRVEGSGELKKNLQMIAEGSVVCAPGALRGAAADVAPDGFAHPVYRAGFAVSIPLPEAV